MMTFYQNVAENGAAIACQGPEKILPCVETNLQNLPKADGVILFDAHLGDGLATFTYVDPALSNNIFACEPRKRQNDMFLEVNGYVRDPGQLDDNSATYSKQFKKTFLVHQAVRNEDLIEVALDLLQQRRIQTGSPNDLGDAIPFVVPGSDGARLWQPDTSLLKVHQEAARTLGSGWNPAGKDHRVGSAAVWQSRRVGLRLVDAVGQCSYLARLKNIAQHPWPIYANAGRHHRSRLLLVGHQQRAQCKRNRQKSQRQPRPRCRSPIDVASTPVITFFVPTKLSMIMLTVLIRL